MACREIVKQLLERTEHPAQGIKRHTDDEDCGVSGVKQVQLVFRLQDCQAQSEHTVIVAKDIQHLRTRYNNKLGHEAVDRILTETSTINDRVAANKCAAGMALQTHMVAVKCLNHDEQMRHWQRIPYSCSARLLRESTVINRTSEALHESVND